jgi:uncharacterized protein YndB with AHSA1/START domain
MATWTSLAVLAGAYLAVRNEQSRSTKLACSTTIKAPSSRVFDIIANVDRIPEWYRRPRLPVGFTVLSRWGEHIPREWRLQNGGASSDEIRIRWIHNREFSYTCRNPHGLSYECTFRIASKDRECSLTWELRYRNPRVLDAVFNRVLIAQATAEVMSRSLQTICRLAETMEVAAAFQKRKEPEIVPVWQERKSKAS